MSDWQTILAIDHDPKACEVYRANIACDGVRCGNVVDHLAGMPYADVILGGPPCQPYSSAGKQEGEDDARDCVPDFCAAVERVKPRMFLMEEVDDFAQAEKFQPVFHRTVKRLEDAGYVAQVRVLDAVKFGVPQFRKRAWLWGIRVDLFDRGVRHKWPTPTHVWPHPKQACMFGGDLLPAVTVGQALGLGQTERAIGGGRHDTVPKTTRDITDEPGVTMVGQWQGHQQIDIHKGGLQQYRWSDTMLEKHPPASPASPASPAPTVAAKWYKGGAEGLVEIDTKQPRTRRSATAPAPAPALAHDSRHEIKRDGLTVRRLTPAECARLQSMPDDFKWPASVAKTHRYRIIGNGWSSLMAKRMSEALKAADPASVTVIDLFCGGGCGAVGWHGRAWEYRA